MQCSIHYFVNVLLFCSSRIVQYFSVVTVSSMVMYMKFCDKRTSDENLTNVIFMHLLTFAAHFGAQFWVTFIAGKCAFAFVGLIAQNISLLRKLLFHKLFKSLFKHSTFKRILKRSTEVTRWRSRLSCHPL